MLNLVLVGGGGFLGSVLRYPAGLLTQSLTGSTALPYGTLAVNVLGCLIIGFLGGLAQHRQLFSPELRLFVFTGMLGGFTTFSTFSLQSIELIQAGRTVEAFVYILGSLVLSILGCWLGIMVARALN